MFTQDLIITTYNSIESCNILINQVIYFSKFFNKIIIVDDKSTDKTFPYLKLRLSSLDNIVLLQNKANNGPSGSRNKGVAISNANYVSFLDSDDIFCKDKFKIINEFCNLNHPDIFFHGYKIIYSKKHKSKILNSNIEIHSKYIYLFKSIYVTPALTIKREIFEKEGGYDINLRYAEDLDLYIRLRMKYNFHYIKSDLVGVYKSKYSISSNRRKMRLSIIKILMKNISSFKFKSIIFIIAITTNFLKLIINK